MLDFFFFFDQIPPSAEVGTYLPARVVLACTLGVLTAHTALLFTDALLSAKTPSERRAGLWGGTLALGAGIWAMHFAGLLSYQMTIVLGYDYWLVALSLLIAIAVAFGTLSIVKRQPHSIAQMLVGGMVLGLGMCVMHYAGMAAIKMDAVLRFQPPLFVLSVAIAAAASCIGLWMALMLEQLHQPYRVLFKLGAALIMGAGFWGMHYVSLAAAVFIPIAGGPRAAAQNFNMLNAVVTAATALGLFIAQGLAAHRVAKAEFRLRDSESKLRAIVDNALDGLAIISPHGIIESFNPTAERMFGYTAAEVIGRNVKMLLVESQHAGHDQFLSRHLLAGQQQAMDTSGCEVCARRKDGSSFDMDLSLSPFRLSEGMHLSATIRDITARKDTERRLQESMQRAQSVVEGALDAIVSVDERGSITEWNAQAERIFGWARAEVLGQAMAELIIPVAQRNLHYAGMRRYLAGGAACILGKRIQMHAQHRKGSTFPVEMAVTDQKVQGRHAFTAFMRDITLQKSAETERDANVRALEISNRELDEFAYIVSHDLKEPLRGLRNQATFLIEDLGDQLNEEGRRRLQRMIVLGERMQQLIEDLLFFSRLGRSEMAIQATDPNHIVRNVEQMLESFIEERRAQIAVPHPMPVILCDKTRVAEVFRNLITNAVKYNDKAQPRVEVGYLSEMDTDRGRESDVFYVRDNGVGIPEEFHDEVFRMFKRLPNGLATDPGGTGAGLTFVKKIIQRHRGRIWLESAVGEGTTFYFTLPQPQPLAGEAAPTAAVAEGRECAA